ncbi:hypothetical protein F0362_13295 [Bacillus sp. BS98]|nr:hypothetical protein F0362_13295 [Bacillus sp. BS98]
MENVSNLDKSESIKSLQSTIRKLENALSQMTQKDANTTLVKKRLCLCIRKFSWLGSVCKSIKTIFSDRYLV